MINKAINIILFNVILLNAHCPNHPIQCYPDQSFNKKWQLQSIEYKHVRLPQIDCQQELTLGVLSPPYTGIQYDTTKVICGSNQEIKTNKVMSKDYVKCDNVKVLTSFSVTYYSGNPNYYYDKLHRKFTLLSDGLMTATGYVNELGGMDDTLTYIYQ